MKKRAIGKWGAVILIASVQGVINLTWMIYNAYLPELLGQLGLAAGMAGTLLVVEKLLAAAIEPASGLVSDQNYRKWGSRYPLIFVGMLLSAVAFFVIPLAASGGSLFLSNIFLFVVVLWAGAMSLFRSPTLVLLRQYAKDAELTQAYSVILLVTGIFAALKQYSKPWILGMGPIFAFGLGSVTLLAGMILLYYLIPAEDVEGEQFLGGYGELRDWIPQIVIIFTAGIFVAFGVRFVGPTVQGFIATYFPDYDGRFLFFSFLILVAFAAIPAASSAKRFGNIRSMLVGAAAAGGAMLLFLLTFHPVWLLINFLALIAGYSIVLNGPVPMALGVMPARWGSFGIGLFYGGFSLAMVLFGKLIQPHMAGLGSSGTAVGGSVSFLLAALVIWWANRVQKNS